MFETLSLETDARGVAILELNRPEKRNAMSDVMIADLRHAADILASDPAVRAVVLRGAGAMFCAGGDLNWMKAQIDADNATRAEEAGKLAAMLGVWNALPKPVIGRIHGGAFGGGVGLASICDVAVSEPGAKFGLTETRLGLIPATIGPYVIARMGEGAARRVFMSSRIFGAAEAQVLGLVAKISDDLDGAVEAEVESYLNCAPGAVAEAKALALRLGGAPSAAEVKASIEALVTRWENPEAEAGVTAFLEKRKPGWAL
ncbi:MAG: crotonase/enoyl-CoA hydratase family protein [Pseudomonadota bacterium]